MKKDKLKSEIEKIILAGEKKENVFTNPFFTTRVMAKIQPEEFPVSKGIFNYAYFIKSAMVVLVIINLANLLWYNSTSVSTEINTKDYSQQVLSYTTNDFVYSSDLLTQNNTNE